MKNYTARIEVKFKAGVLDPQGVTIKNALLNLDYKTIEKVATGKLFWVDLLSKSKADALKEANSLADKLLANTVIENFEVEITE